MFLITNGKASIVKYTSLAVKHMGKDSVRAAHQSKFMKNHHNKSRILKRLKKTSVFMTPQLSFYSSPLAKQIKRRQIVNV